MALDRTSVTRFLARGAALSFALLASCYLIYSAQRRADTTAADVRPPGDAGGSEATGGPASRPGSPVPAAGDPTVLDADGLAAGRTPPTEGRPVLLGTSKSMSPDALEPLPGTPTLAPGAGATAVLDPAANTTFLPSSKVLILDAPLSTTQGVSASPTFLGGTKSAVIETEIVPPPKAAPQGLPAAPAQPDATNAAPKKPQVFLPSSKSFRMRESPAPAPQPAEPQAPPEKHTAPGKQPQPEPRS